MFTTEPNKTCNNSLHLRNNSGELHVFEAAQYFSVSHGNEATFSQKTIRNEILDTPMMKNNKNHDHNNPLTHPDSNPVTDQKQLKENKKSYKQPSSPGGRLASFLNAIFNQTAAKKKKKSKSGKNLDQEENHVWPRKRRSSISHFTITSSRITNDSKSIYPSSSSGFRTPPPCADTPTKSYKEFTGFVSGPGNDENAEKSRSDIFKNDIESFGFPERHIVNNSARNVIWAADEERDQFRKFSDVDDGADSDSSSDLFDLPNHDLDFYSNGLPVYGTTHIDRIRIAAPISRAATV